MNTARRLYRAGLALLLAGVLSGQAAPSPEGVFAPDRLTAIDAAIDAAIANHRTPGAVFWLEHQGRNYARAYGQRGLIPQAEAASADTIYDAASLTKSMATAPSVLLLIERRQLYLDMPVKTVLPEFDGAGCEKITLRHLLTHTSGLRPGLSRATPWSGYRKGIELACAEKPQDPPGTVFRYSDINFILLGEIVRRASETTLDEFVAREFYRPLKMTDTGFLPSVAKLTRIAPTERDGGSILRGVVHDPTSRRMGGVAGHAGVFTTAADLARFVRMILNGGELEGVRVLKPETVRLMTTVQSPEGVEARRGLGWDIDSGYSRPRGTLFPLGSFGHTGWTGTCVWIDPFSRTFWIFLSNRVHPDGKGNVLELEARLGTLAAEAVSGFDFANVKGALPPRPTKKTTKKSTPASASASTWETKVSNGVDTLVSAQFAPLKGLRVGLVTNHTGTDHHRRSTIDLLRQAPGVRLQALFSPEHGIRGDRDEKIDDSRDEKTGLPIHSLYGETRQPTPAQLQDLDALVFDIQDIGCRFYTYISTLLNTLEAADKARLKVFVLDRVNPINGVTVEGPVLAMPPSFIACHPLPVRHGLTVGELARLFHKELDLKLDLTVIPVRGWRRNLWFDGTELPWTNPSPNMRNLNEATLYPGVGLLETTALSVGRGTDTPFELFGAPYIDDVWLAAELNKAGLTGVRFVPVRFTPKASVFQGQECGGVFLVILDRQRLSAVDIGIVAAQILHRRYPADFDLEKFNHLLRHPATLEAIKAGKTLSQIKALWAEDLRRFKQRSKSIRLYRG